MHSFAYPRYCFGHHLVEDNGKDDDDQNNGQDEQEDTSLTPRALLVVACLLQIHMRASRCIMCDLDVLLNDVELRTLLMYHMCNIAEQLIKFTN